MMIRNVKGWHRLGALSILCGWVGTTGAAVLPVKTAPAPVTRVAGPAAGAVAPRKDPTNLMQTAVLQVALDRNGFGVGLIDGREGAKTTQALRDYAASRGCSPAQARKELLNGTESAFIDHALTAEELARVGAAPSDYLEASAVPAMACESLEEVLAEQFHISDTLLKRINIGVSNWQAVAVGTLVRVPNTRPEEWSARAGRLEVDCQHYRVRAYDDAEELIASFPCSIAKKLDKVPVGDLTIVSFAPNPNYTFDPANFPESPRAREIGKKLIIPPGPNNPVGVYWLTLSAPGFGMHGTPRPETIGRRESHGCFRLTNWDIRTLARMVAEGTPVTVELEAP